METSLFEEDTLNDDGQDMLINFPPEVQKAIEQVFLTSKLKLAFHLKPTFFYRFYPVKTP